MGLIALFFENFFDSSAMTNKFFEDGIYAIGKVHSYENQTPKLKKIRKCSVVKVVSTILKS